MARAKRTAGSDGARQRSEEDLHRVIVDAPDPQALGRAIRELELDAGSLHRDPASNAIEAELFLTKAQIAELRKYGWPLEVHENLSEIGRRRQKEVAKGDRFKGGTVPPKGLGTKPGREA